VECFIAERKDSFAEDTEGAGDAEDSQRLAREPVEHTQRGPRVISYEAGNQQCEDASTQPG
jgi:hypothetical protein